MTPKKLIAMQQDMERRGRKLKTMKTNLKRAAFLEHVKTCPACAIKLALAKAGPSGLGALFNRVVEAEEDAVQQAPAPTHMVH